MSLFSLCSYIYLTIHAIDRSIIDFFPLWSIHCIFCYEPKFWIDVHRWNILLNCFFERIVIESFETTRPSLICSILLFKANIPLNHGIVIVLGLIWKNTPVASHGFFRDWALFFLLLKTISEISADERDREEIDYSFASKKKKNK